MEPVPIVRLLNETREVLGYVRERVERHGIDRSTFRVFMKLSAVALTYGLPRRPIEPRRPFAVKTWRYGAAAYCAPRSE
jgi:hypothetical protein